MFSERNNAETLFTLDGLDLGVTRENHKHASIGVHNRTSNYTLARNQSGSVGNWWAKHSLYRSILSDNWIPRWPVSLIYLPEYFNFSYIFAWRRKWAVGKSSGSVTRIYWTLQELRWAHYWAQWKIYLIHHKHWHFLAKLGFGCPCLEQ